MNGEKNNRTYDLIERTAMFGENIIRFCKKVFQNPITIPLITQLVKAGTSVGANYSEADNAESKRGFKHKIGIVKKESKESQHFLRMISVAAPEMEDLAKPLNQEAHELNLIFNSIYNKVKD